MNRRAKLAPDKGPAKRCAATRQQHGTDGVGGRRAAAGDHLSQMPGNVQHARARVDSWRRSLGRADHRAGARPPISLHSRCMANRARGYGQRIRGKAAASAHAVTSTSGAPDPQAWVSTYTLPSRLRRSLSLLRDHAPCASVYASQALDLVSRRCWARDRRFSLTPLLSKQPASARAARLVRPTSRAMLAARYVS